MRFLTALLVTVIVSAALPGTALTEPDPRELAVEVSASVNGENLVLQWPYHDATGYSVARKELNQNSWSLIASLPGSATSFADRIGAGNAYEYQILRSGAFTASGYLYGGIAVPAVESRGVVLLVTTAAASRQLTSELALFRQDLIADGWSVTPITVEESDPPSTVRGRIRDESLKYPGQTRVAILLGHVPVARSGNFAPDGHGDHFGAWSADTYYADIDGNWSDSSVYATSASKSFNHNVPGDGKFDQNEIPSDVELEVGRIDFSMMTCFSNKSPSRDEAALLRQYLRKNHAYRMAGFSLERRGAIADNFGWHDGDAFSAGAYRTYAPLFGANRATVFGSGTFFPTLNSNAYLWSFGAGGGDWVSCAGIGDSNDFALNDPRSVFTTFIGSYFGDWDHESNFLRAALGSSNYTLTTAWAGRPAWFFHHMALGREIGLSAKISQNNSGLYYPVSRGARGVHVALMGDPTLRAFPVVPPSALKLSDGALTWTASPDSQVAGYYVYRAASPEGPYARVTGQLVTGTRFSPVEPSGYYLVKSVKLENTGSGTYFNTSQGVSLSEPAPASPPLIGANNQAAQVISPPADPKVTYEAGAGLLLSWADTSNGRASFSVERLDLSKRWRKITETAPRTTDFLDRNVRRNVSYAYRIQAIVAGKSSVYSPEAWGAVPAASLPPTEAALVSLDWNTSGNWEPSYGSHGLAIPHFQDTLDGLISSSRPQNKWVWEYETADTRALAFNGRGRAVTFYDNEEIVLDIKVVGRGERTLSLYLLDWDRQGRKMRLTTYNQKGEEMSSQTIENFSEGVYASIVLAGVSRITLKNLQGPNAVLSGLFLDPTTRAQSRKAKRMTLQQRRRNARLQRL